MRAGQSPWLGTGAGQDAVRTGMMTWT
jgi:hypothetical protein